MNKIKVLKKVNMFCSICGEEHELDLCEELDETIIKKEKVNYICHYYRCNKYKNENTFMTEDMWNESLINSLDSYRIEKDLLTSKEIKKIRNKYKLSQAELAFLMGLGEITITRYETKQIQENSNDSLLKEINNNAIFTLKLLENNKNKFSSKRFEEISENIKNIIDSETISYLKQEEIKAKYVKYDKKSLENGNCILNIEKLSNVLGYITKTMKSVKKVVLMKLLWFIDAYSFKEYGKAITGLVYEHRIYGALPIAYDELLELPSINYEIKISDDEKYEYKIFANKDYKVVGLSKQEKEIINKVINKFKNFKSHEIAEYMHEERAYKETKSDQIITFDLTKDLREF